MENEVSMSQPCPDPVRIAVTMGDPAGVGPELCAKILSDPPVDETQLIVFGDWQWLQAAADLCHCRIDAGLLSRAPGSDKALDNHDFDSNRHWVVDYGHSAHDELVHGQVTALGGRASYQYLTEAIEAALSRKVDAVVTAPINKASLRAAGFSYPGHTEILSDKTGTRDYGMMLTSPELTCSLATTHVPISEVPGLLTSEAILRLIRLTDVAIRKIRNRDDARLTVLGLNPHAGEEGLFGDEEARIIQPAIDEARREGFTVRGPVPPDTAFLPAIRKETDGYICMYHDQGLIPLKTLAFDTAVNVTLGLPLIRTSVDHGTAYDIAWKNKVQTSSMVAALKLAKDLVT